MSKNDTFPLIKDNHIEEIEEDIHTLISYYDDKITTPFDQWICNLFKADISFYSWLNKKWDTDVAMKYTIFCIDRHELSKLLKEYQIKHIQKEEDK